MQMSKKKKRSIRPRVVGPTGRPAIHGGERVAVQLWGNYEARIEKLMDLLEQKRGQIVTARNVAVQTAIDAFIYELEQEDDWYR